MIGRPENVGSDTRYQRPEVSAGRDAADRLLLEKCFVSEIVGGGSTAENAVHRGSSVMRWEGGAESYGGRGDYSRY